MMQGGKPVTVDPGLMLMFALIVPPDTQVNDNPAMIPFGAADRSTPLTGGATLETMTVASAEMEPLVALTVFVKVPVSEPAVKRPVDALIDPPPFTTDHCGVMAIAPPRLFVPAAANC